MEVLRSLQVAKVKIILSHLELQSIVELDVSNQTLENDRAFGDINESFVEDIMVCP